MGRARLFLLTLLALLAFAGNSLLCRAAFHATRIDAASFTTIRIVAGALTLWLIARLRRPERALAGTWPSALALFVYAAAFSFAYVSLPAATGALLLFGAVQATMLGFGFARGDRLRGSQLLGLAAALGGLVGLLLPGLSAPPLTGSALMLVAGIAWGVYTLHGQGGGDPLRVTAGNFVRAVPLAAALSVASLHHASLDGAGVALAIASGALTSGLGYAIWYTALPALKTTIAATLQLSVPVLAALGGVVLLGEQPTTRLAVAALLILGGIALVIAGKGRRAVASPSRVESR
jgi:drug/metabolite transporter (DMT)-like permease